VIKEEFKEVSTNLFLHLNNKLNIEGGYPDEPTWGYAFSYLLAHEMGLGSVSTEMASKALSFYLAQKKPKNSYSWEFTVYAMQRVVRLHGTEVTFKGLDNYDEKGTRMVNWTLLRQLNRMNAGFSQSRASAILYVIRKVFTTSQGQILDELKTRSYQYHCFCLFILAEIYDQYPSEPLKDWFLKGCSFIEAQAFNSGVALYVGRGQEQIFGYAAVIFALSFAQERLGYKSSGSFQKIWEYVKGFQRPDGSFPLVLRLSQPENPNVGYDTHHPPGWYSYNTLYDYQPFLAYCLIRASKV
jgi:hypothetical protein